MNPLGTFILICMLTMGIPLPGMAQLEKGNLDAQRAVVVKLRIHRTNQPDETASGLYVGKDAQSAYFVTAYHAIGPNARGVRVQSVQIQFYSTPQNLTPPFSTTSKQT